MLNALSSTTHSANFPPASHDIPRNAVVYRPPTDTEAVTTSFMPASISPNNFQLHERNVSCEGRTSCNTTFATPLA